MSEAAARPNLGQSTALDSGALLQLLYIAAFGVLGLGVVLWALAQWNEGGAGNAADAATGTVTLVLSQEPPQLDSTRSTDGVSIGVLGHVMEGLLRYDANNDLVGGVAERWDIGDTKWTFWLREDARWSNGAPVTAHDFVFAWRTALAPATASEYAFILYGIKNAKAINDGDLPVDALGVRAVGDRQLEVEFGRPLPYFDKLAAFCTFNPVNEAFYRSTGGAYGADADKLLYNGPFVIAQWIHGASLRLEKNPRYWGAGRIRLNAIDYAYITSDTNATLNLFKDGKAALAGLNAENLTDAMQQRWKIRRFADGSVYYLSMNHRPGRPTSNYKLRKALQTVHDPSELVYKIIKLPGNLPTNSLFPVWLKGVHGSFRQEYPAPQHRPDDARGRALLAEALDELGLDEMPPLVMLIGDSPTSKKQAEYYQNLFKRKLGIDIKIDAQIFKQRLAKMTAGDFDLVAAGWGPDYDDVMTFGDLFTSWNENNRGRYANPVVDQWVEIARSSSDPRTRMDAMAKVQQILYDDAAVLMQYERGTVYVAHPRLKGLVRRSVGADPDYTNAWIEPIGGAGATATSRSPSG